VSQVSPLTAAYSSAKEVCGLPETERETLLFQALQDALEKLHDHATLHGECNEKLKDASDELVKADKSRLREAPEADANLVVAKRLLADRRHHEPLVPPGQGYGGDYSSSVRYERFVADREVTDLLEQLIEEVEAYRKLAGVTT
jgi:hypothetical protein